MRGKKSGTLYKTVDARCLINVDVGNKTTNQWHPRLGHTRENEKLKNVSFQKSSITAKKDKLVAETDKSSREEELVRQSSAQQRRSDCYRKDSKIGDSCRWELKKKVQNTRMYRLEEFQQKAGIKYIDIFAPVVKEIEGKLKLCPTSVGLLE